MSGEPERTAGQIAFEVYRKEVFGQGKGRLDWDQLLPKFKAAWEKAAHAVLINREE